jgi:hypothetical protein
MVLREIGVSGYRASAAIFAEPFKEENLLMS